MNDRDGGMPIEQFIQALTSQLDRAQATMALKARAGLPLTFAVKDISLDLRTHVEMVGSVVRIRPAAPGEVEASVLHLALTTITRPMIEENTAQLAPATDEPSLKEALADEMTEDEQRRLEWVGVHSLSQLRDLQRQTGAQAIERVVDLPVNRLRAALEKATHPFVRSIVPEWPDGPRTPETPPLLHIRGHNLMQDHQPEVRISGEPVPLVHANPREIVIAPEPHQLAGALEVETGPGAVATTNITPTSLRIRPHTATDKSHAAPDAPVEEGGAQ